MIFHNYSRKQLEERAYDLLRAYDPERIIKCKTIDVYEVIEKCLNVPYDWKYITPDQSILGLTAYQAGILWVWPKSHYIEGMKPHKIYLEEDTILIDSTLTERDDRGLENFTVMHEIFHQVLHKQWFKENHTEYTYISTQTNLENLRKPTTLQERCEQQANACAAAFLMPQTLVESQLKHYHINYILDFNKSEDRKILVELAKEFNVTKTAFKNRLINLGYAYQECWR